MTRRLPWKKSGEHDASTASPRRTITKREESPRSLASPARIAIARQTATPRNRQSHSTDALRSPSSSPPPEVPAEQFMKPEDDRYRMVEDELLGTARRFTTHLHRAEYERLKRLARSQNEDSIREIERPVVGTPTMEARRRHDRVAQRIKQRSVPGEQTSSSPMQPSTGLRRLLDAPRSEDLSLSSVAPRLRVPTTVAPRAAQRVAIVSPGVGPSSARISATPARVAASPGIGPSSANISATPVRSAAAARQLVSSQLPRTPVTPATSTAARSHPIIIGGEKDELDAEDPFGIQKRNIRRKQSREQFGSAKRPPPKRDDSMPHFI